MNRRNFITAAAGAALAMSAPSVLIAAGAETLDYSPGLIEERLAAGETLFVDYAADWCGTCKRQERVVSDLRKANPSINDHITFIRVDWDDYGSSDVATERGVSGRSTLLVLRGDEELGRIVAGTGKEQISSLIELGLPT